VKVNIIHGGYSSRIPILQNELFNQEIFDYKIWEGLHDKDSVVTAINKSHKMIVWDALEKGLEEVCIFEDDVKFTDFGAWDYFLQNKPKSFDLYLGGIYLGDILPNNTVKSFTALHCYIIHSKFYATFLSTPDNQHLDRSLDNLGDYHICNPMVAVQYDGWSANTGKDETYDNLLQNRSLFKKKYNF
jgi:hypothetical protein